MVDLLTRSPLQDVLVPGRHGRPDGAPGVTLAERIVGGAVSLAARKEGSAPLAAALGWALPERRHWIAVDLGRLFWTGPGRWLLLSDEAVPDLVADLSRRVGATGSLSDQSDARMVLQVGGALAGDALAKGVAIDLHPRAFLPGDVAVTLVGHVSALLWREESGFGIAVARGYAASMTEFLMASALEFGLEVR